MFISDLFDFAMYVFAACVVQLPVLMLGYIRKLYCLANPCPVQRGVCSNSAQTEYIPNHSAISGYCMNHAQCNICHTSVSMLVAVFYPARMRRG